MGFTGLELLLLLVRPRVMVSIRVGVRVKGLELLLLLVRTRVMVSIRVGVRVNPSGYTNPNGDAPLSGAWHVLWGPTGTPWGRAEGCTT